MRISHANQPGFTAGGSPVDRPSTLHPASPAAHRFASAWAGTAIRALMLLTVLSTMAAVVAAAGARLDRAATAAARNDEPIYLPRAEFLRPMSLGWQNVLADVLWFRTISYFGEHFRSDRTYPWLAQMCDLVTDLDPRAEHVYRFAGFVLPWEANQADAGIRLLEKGARQFPNSWVLEYFVGFHYYFFKNDYPNALEHLRRAVQLPGVHPSVPALIAVLSAEHYGPQTTMAFLAELEHDVDSQELRDVVRENLQEARLADDLQHLDAAVDAYRTATGHAPLTIEALVDAGVISEVPADPFGGIYVVDPLIGAVRSSTGHEPSRLHQSKLREKALRGEPLRDP
jgi:hypothetical protein